MTVAASSPIMLDGNRVDPGGENRIALRPARISNHHVMELIESIAESIIYFARIQANPFRMINQLCKSMGLT